MASASASSSRAGSSAAVWARMQQQFIQGKNTDMVIRVRVAEQEAQQQPQQQQAAGPSSKRRRTGKGKATAAAASSSSSSAAAAADQYTDIKAHTLVLCARSAYFDKALEGDWAEAAERRVELVVEDEQSVEDLKLLIKLAYSDSYTHDGGQLLPVDVRLRLAVRADALEFVEAVDQVVESLTLGLDFAGAIMCLGNLPPAVEGHPGMAAVREQVAALLVKGIEERDENREGEAMAQAQKAADALARCLGPVHEMFETPSRLREDVKQLPLCVLKRLLTSEALQLQSENEAFTLMQSWLEESPRVMGNAQQRKAAFQGLVPLLRYHHMTPDFVANVVSLSWHFHFENVSMLHRVISSAFGQRGVPSALLEQSKAPRGGANRGLPPSEARWEINASFTLEEVMALRPGEEEAMLCRPIFGYSFYICIARAEEEDKLNVVLNVEMCTYRGDAFDGAPRPGVGLILDATLSPGVKYTWTHFFDGEDMVAENVFKKPWGEVVREGSPHFPGGKLEVKLTVRLVTNDAQERERARK